MTKLFAGSEPTLLLSPEAPYPLAGGGPMRTASVLHYLAERSTLHLITFAEEGSADAAAALPPGLCGRVSQIPLPVHGRGSFAKIMRNGGRLLRRRLPLSDRFCQPESLSRVDAETQSQHYSLAVIEHFWAAGYLDLLRTRADRVVLNLHNIESVLHGGCAVSEGRPQRWAHRAFESTARSLEKLLLPQFDLVLVTSAEDAGRVLDLAPGARVGVYPNALPLRAEPPQNADAEREVIAFSGNLEYHPNVTAVHFFHSKVWPELSRRRPGLVWKLIGKNEHAVRSIVGNDPRIELTGPIEDPLVELAKCRLAVVPLLAGSGTRVKIMEAWAARRAVISSPIGAEGLPTQEGVNLALAREPNEWLETVVDLLEDNERRALLGAAGRSTYERELSWPAAWKRLEVSLTSVEERFGSNRGGLVMAE